MGHHPMWNLLWKKGQAFISCGTKRGKGAQPLEAVNPPKTPGRFSPNHKERSIRATFQGAPLWHEPWNLDWFIGILILVMAYYNPQRTGWSNALHAANNHGFDHCCIWVPTYLQHIGTVHISYIIYLYSVYIIHQDWTKNKNQKPRQKSCMNTNHLDQTIFMH